MNQYFGVAGAVKLESASDQLRAEVEEVVDRAVKNHSDGAVGRCHGLPAGVAQVKNGKATMSQYGAGPALHTFGIGPPAGQRRNHGAHDVLGIGCIAIPNVTRDSAHYL